jgi:DNA-3-methyladenine glycosylase II
LRIGRSSLLSILAGDLKGNRPAPANFVTRAEAWRPYRAYAAQHIWAEEEVTVIFKR